MPLGVLSATIRRIAMITLCFSEEKLRLIGEESNYVLTLCTLQARKAGWIFFTDTGIIPTAFHCKEVMLVQKEIF